MTAIPVFLSREPSRFLAVGALLAALMYCPEALPAAESLWLADLGTEHVVQGWGSPGVDRSVEGNPLSISGRAFARGIGTHSPGEIHLDLGGTAENFSAWVGLDDEGGANAGRGSVEFIVLGDGRRLWGSGIMRGGDPAARVSVRLGKVKRLVLQVTDGGDGYAYDHADWAEARISHTGRAPSMTAPYREPVSFSDDFSADSLGDLSRYAQYRKSWSVTRGSLTASFLPGETATLHILPGWGANAELSLRARSPAGTKVTLAVLVDSRYGAGTATPIYVNLDAGSVMYPTGEGYGVTEAAFTPGKWATFRFLRSGNRYALFVDGRELGGGPLAARSGGLNDPSAALYGGFTLNCEPNADPGGARRIIQVDDLSAGGDAAPVAYGAMEASFDIEGAPHWFTVVHEIGYEAWARGQLKVSVPFLAWCSDFYGVPPIHERLGMTQSRGEYFSGWNGFNADGVVLWRADHGYPEFLNDHELAHNWQHCFANRWSAEGFAGIATQARSEEGGTYVPLHRMEKGAREIKDRGWVGLARSLMLDDDRIFDGMDLDGGGMTADSVHVAYWKSMVLTGIIYRLHGGAGIQAICREAQAAGHALDTRGIKAALDSHAGSDQAALFAGLAFPGKGAYPIDLIFVDADNDGLSDLEERVLGTSAVKADSDGDGMDDFSEASHGSLP